jgi:hypothetical protein
MAAIAVDLDVLHPAKPLEPTALAGSLAIGGLDSKSDDPEPAFVRRDPIVEAVVLGFVLGLEREPGRLGLFLTIPRVALVLGAAPAVFLLLVGFGCLILSGTAA